MKLELNITNGNLRDALLNEGFAFPCGGKGICGKCKILAPDLQITPLDKRFISADDLASGVRLACDKSFDGSIQIDTLALKKSTFPKKLLQPEIVAGLYDTHTVVAILEDGEIVESEVFESASLSTNDLRGIVGKNSIEFYEKYGIAKAITIMVIGTKERMDLFTKSCDLERFTCGDTVDASTYDMPAEDVYLPPLTKMAGGSIALLELMDSPLDSLVISLTNNIPTVMYNGSHIIAASLNDTNVLVGDIKAGILSPEVASLIATVAFFADIKECSNLVFYSNNLSVSELEAIFSSCDLTKNVSISVKTSSAMDTAISVLASNRLKAKLNKFAMRVSYIFLPDDNLWQNKFTLVSQ